MHFSSAGINGTWDVLYPAVFHLCNIRYALSQGFGGIGVSSPSPGKQRLSKRSGSLLAAVSSRFLIVESMMRFLPAATPPK